MTEVCRQHFLARVVIVVLWNHFVSVSGYENAYDLTERRNQHRNDPGNRFYEASERYYNRDRYSTHNSNPSSVYTNTVSRPGEGDYGVTRRSTGFGNGYDNLGNGRSADFQFRDRRRFSEPRRFDSFRTGSRFDEPRRLDTFVTRSDDRYFDSFRDQDHLGDRAPLDSFRDVNSGSLDPYRDEPRLEERNLEPFRDDHRSIDLAREGSRLDGPRIIEAFPETHRRINRFDEPRRFDRLPEVRTFDEPRSFSSSRHYDSGSNWDRPSLNHHSDHPAFYRKDYFVPTPSTKSSGFEAKNSDNNYQKSGGEKENSGLSTVGSYITSNEDKNQKKAEQGYHDKKEGANLDVENREKIGETTRFDKNGGNKSTVRSNRVQKKGHTTKGFATHHHKDETGNSTTFFDESSDTGGQSDFQDLEDEFGSRKTMEVLNGKEDGRFFQQKTGKNGNFGSGVLKDNKKVEKDIVANDNRFNNEEKYGSGQDQEDRGYKTASEYIGGGVWQDPHHY